MRLNFAFLADSAQSLPDGRFSVLGGGVTVLYIKKFPALQPTLTLVVQFDVNKAEVDREHELRLELFSPLNATAMPPVTSKFTPSGNVEHPEWPMTALFILNTTGLVFEMPGRHEFRISVDNVEKARLPLFATYLTELRK